jgi:hypothetical protein
MSTNSRDSIKTVANGERIALGIDRDELADIADAYGVEDLEALLMVFETGYDELDARATMLDEESDVYARDDGAHIVNSSAGGRSE